MSLALFEIHDKVIQIEAFYLWFFILGLVGFALGIFRWWAGIVWRVMPILLFLLLFEDLYSLHDDLMTLFGNSYFWHFFLAVGIGMTLNLLGPTIGFRRMRNNLE